MFLLTFWTSFNRDCCASKKDSSCDARSVVSKWKLRANAAEMNTVQTDCRVRWITWWSFCYSLCWGQRYLVTSDGSLKAPFYVSSSFFFLFSSVGAGWRNVAVIGRSQTWSYRGSLDGQPPTWFCDCPKLPLVWGTTAQKAVWFCPPLGCERGHRQSPAAQSPSSVQNSHQLHRILSSRLRMSFSWLIKVSRRCEACMS